MKVKVFYPRGAVSKSTQMKEGNHYFYVTVYENRPYLYECVFIRQTIFRYHPNDSYRKLGASWRPRRFNVDEPSDIDGDEQDFVFDSYWSARAYAMKIEGGGQ